MGDFDKLIGEVLDRLVSTASSDPDCWSTSPARPSRKDSGEW
jgi:hypothetical protein